MIDVDLQMPAEIFQEAVSVRSGVPSLGFTLYYQSKRLEGEAALSSWGVEKKAIIEVKTRGRGGVDATKTKEATPKVRSQSSVEADAKLQSRLEAATTTDASSSHATFAAASADGGESAKAAVVEKIVPPAERLEALLKAKKVNESDISSPPPSSPPLKLKTRSEVKAAEKQRHEAATAAEAAKAAIPKVSLLLCHPY